MFDFARLLFIVLFVCVPCAVHGAGVEFFSPQGEVARVRQVTARFDEQIVEFGDPRAPAPFDVQCAEKGAGRWVDGRNWSYDFDRDLPAGIRCEFVLKPGLRSLAGAAVEAKRFVFSTGGPKVVRSWPGQGSRMVREDQKFLLQLNVPANEASVRDHVRCVVGEAMEQTPVVLLDEAEARALEKLNMVSIRDTRPRLALKCARPLPNKATVTLTWSKAVASQSNVTSERDQILSFVVREALTAYGSCNEGGAVKGCNPTLPVVVSFNASVPRAVAEQVRLKLPDGTLTTPDVGVAATLKAIQSVTFAGPFPENSNVVVTLPANLRDEDGRPLSNPELFPKTLHIGEPNPAIRFASGAIVERNAGGVLPVMLQNVEESVTYRYLRVGGPKQLPSDGDVREWMQRLQTAVRADESVLTGLAGVETAVVRKRLRATLAENVEIPLKEPGYYIVEIDSPRHAMQRMGRRYVRTAVLVTNVAVHFKSGPENALAWVTRLDTAEPIADAAVTLRDCHNTLLWEGRSDAQGLARIDRPLPTAQNCATGTSFLAFARVGDDVGFTHTYANYHAFTPAFSSGLMFASRPMGPIPGWNVHTVFDRSLLRAGETVHMKHFMRRETLGGLAVANIDREDGVEISHALTEKAITLPIRWSADGTATTSWRIPDDAKLGRYRVAISYGDRHSAAESGSFRVEEFRTPTIRAELKSEAPQYVDATELPYRMRLAYMSGGPSRQTVTLRTKLAVYPVRFEGFEDFTFPGPVYWRQTAPPTLLDPLRVELDERGEARAIVDNIPRHPAPSLVTTEMEFADSSGEIQTVASVARVWPAALVLGMKRERPRAADPDSVGVQTVTLDVDGNMRPGTPVRVEAFIRTRVSELTVGPDGADHYVSHVTDTPTGLACSGVSDARAVFNCTVKHSVSAEIVFKAESIDASGKLARMELSTYVYLGRVSSFGPASQQNEVDLYPDRVGYRPGDIARVQVNVPHENMRALVTVEREGIAESRVQRLDAGVRELEVPIRATYAPNVYVSVLLVSGRRGRGNARENTDPDKPAFFFGTRELRVAPSAYTMSVQVTPDREAYAPRQRVKVKVKATLPDGTPARNAEVALAAVDEALLALEPNTSWKLLESILRRRVSRVASATALVSVVGERATPQTLGIRGLSQEALAKPKQAKPEMMNAEPAEPSWSGEPARELFDTLLKWQARVRLDENGEALVDVPLNDSLTAFRIVAVAHSGADRFGTGEALIRSTTALAIVSGLPPLVREGDAFRAMATLRNTGTKPMQVEFSAKARRTGTAVTTSLPATTLNVNLAAGESRDVDWRVTVPVNTEVLAWELAARNRAGEERDAIRIAQTVVPAVPLTVQQATLAQIDKPLSMKVALPREAIPGRGGVTVALRASLIDGLDGVRRFMDRYPYRSLEQNVSRAIALHDEAAWRRIMATLDRYLDERGLLRYHIDAARQGSDALTSYVLAIAAEAGWTVPQDVRARMLDGLRSFVEGRITAESWAPRSDVTYRKLAAIDALSRYGLAHPEMLKQIHVEPNAWPTSAVIDWMQIHQRNRNYPNAPAMIDQAQQIVRSRLNLQGTTMGFSTERDDYLWWLMVSPDLNAVRAIVALLPESRWKEDIPRMVRGALQRQQRGHWATTTANAWGTVAMRKFSQLFESATVSGQTGAALGGRSSVRKWQEPADRPLRFDWPAGTDTLRIEHNGSGSPWATVQSIAAVPLKAPFSSGYRVAKRVEAVQRRTPGVWSRGDVVRVTLELEAQSDMTHVVVSDPIPASSTLLGSGLGRDSAIASATEPRRGYWQAPFEERTFAAYRAYYDFVPKGKWTTQYTLRLNNDGRFEQPQTRVEAIYAPEMFGELPNPPVVVRP